MGMTSPSHHPSLAPSALANASRTVKQFTIAAAATGAIPVPSVLAAIVAENAAMIATLASELGVPVTVETVVQSLGIAGSLNLLGRAVFVEAARAIGWFAGPAGVAGVIALGAATAGIQTWVVGRLAIEIAKNQGRPLAPSAACGVVNDATMAYGEWRRSEAN